MTNIEIKIIQCDVVYKGKKRIIVDVGGQYLSAKVNQKINNDTVILEYTGSLLKEDFKIVNLY